MLQNSETIGEGQAMKQLHETFIFQNTSLVNIICIV